MDVQTETTKKREPAADRMKIHWSITRHEFGFKPEPLCKIKSWNELTYSTNLAEINCKKCLMMMGVKFKD